MSVHFVALADATSQPWRNGGGVTRELLAWAPATGGPPARSARPAADRSAKPPTTRTTRTTHAAGSGWTLRVSIADITQDGPFSAFPGVERCFTVLEGAGVELTLDGRTIPLTPAEAPLRFDGAAAPGCRLRDGPTRDLNLMVRRDAGRAGMARAEPGMAWSPVGMWRGLYIHGPAVVDLGHGPRRLASAGLAWMARPEDGGPRDLSSHGPAPWTLIRGGPAWWLWVDAPEEPT